MTALRILSSLVLLAAALMAAATADLSWLLIALGVSFLLRVVGSRSLSHALRGMGPIAAFAGTVALLQWVSGRGGSLLPLKTLSVFLLSTAAFQTLPWSTLITRISSRTAAFHYLLYVFFIRHFMVILSTESQRLLRARALAAPRAMGRDSFRSLTAAVASLAERSLIRAERFYAAQYLRGWAR